MKITIIFLFLLMTAGLYAQINTQNTLTSKEKKEGWKLLFDGKTTSGWHNFKSDKIGKKLKDWKKNVRR